MFVQDYNNVENSMLELVFAPAAKWIARSDDDIIQGMSTHLCHVTHAVQKNT